MWLNALKLDTDIPAPTIVPTRSGEYVTPIRVAGVPDAWNATLMNWLPGKLLGHYLTEKNLEKMGILFAKLHRHGAEWTPPKDFTTRRFEHWISRGEEDCLSGVRSGMRSDTGSDAGAAVIRMDRLVQQAYTAIDRADLRVIHCDLWHDNIKLHHGVLCPFDFEDTVWGFRSHDIAMATLDLLEDTDDDRYPALLAAFRRGYESSLTWPEDPIEPFQIGRLLWKLNWIARRMPGRLAHAIDLHIPIFEHYEMTGDIARPS